MTTHVVPSKKKALQTLTLNVSMIIRKWIQCKEISSFYTVKKNSYKNLKTMYFNTFPRFIQL